MLPSSKPKTAERRLDSPRSANDFHNFAADDMEAPLGRDSPAALMNAGQAIGRREELKPRD
jgi:hypothetical protein